MASALVHVSDDIGSAVAVRAVAIPAEIAGSIRVVTGPAVRDTAPSTAAMHKSIAMVMAGDAVASLPVAMVLIAAGAVVAEVGGLGVAHLADAVVYGIAVGKSCGASKDDPPDAGLRIALLVDKGVASGIFDIGQVDGSADIFAVSAAVIPVLLLHVLVMTDPALYRPGAVRAGVGGDIGGGGAGMTLPALEWRWVIMAAPAESICKGVINILG